MSTLGSKMRLAGVADVLVHEAEKLTAELEQEKSKTAYWYRRAKTLEETAQVPGEADV